MDEIYFYTTLFVIESKAPCELKRSCYIVSLLKNAYEIKNCTSLELILL